jgi:hypothetical protein
MGGAVEHRAVVRFPLHLPVIFRWNDQPMMKKERLGRTRDLSVSGLFVLCPAPPSVGTLVDVEVRLPSFEGGKTQRLRLDGRGKVVRISGPKEPSGFAATSAFVLHEVEDWSETHPLAEA